VLETNKFYNIDCLDGFKEIPNNTIDLIVTDPPFFLKLDHHKTRTWFKRNFADLGMIESFFKQVFSEIGRVLKPTGRIYVFCDGQSYPLFWYHLFPFTKKVRPLIWDKKTSINGYSWRHQHELIIFAEMPEAIPVKTGDGDILRYSAVPVRKRKHPAEKPVDLLKRFIEKSSDEGDLVLDCFAGCGSTLIACEELNRNYIGFEKEKEYYITGIKNLEERKCQH